MVVVVVGDRSRKAELGGGREREREAVERVR